MPSQSPQPDTIPAVRIVQKEQNHRLSGDSQVPPAKIHVSIPACERDAPEGGSSEASSFPGQNSSPSLLLNNSGVADITQCATFSLSATQGRSMITPTAIQSTTCHSTPAPRETSKTDWMHCILSRLACGIASLPTHLSGFENVPTAIPNPKACATITNPPPTEAIERNDRKRQWQLQLQAVSTPRSVVSGSLSVHYDVNTDMVLLVLAMSRLMQLNLWNTELLISASDLEMLSCATWRAAKALAKAPHW